MRIIVQQKGYKNLFYSNWYWLILAELQYTVFVQSVITVVCIWGFFYLRLLGLQFTV